MYDALVAGDVDHAAFEEGLSPETLVRWVPLGDLWSFWRGGKLTKQAIHKALSTAYELYLFDARWFLDTLTSKGGALRGTDVLSDGLTKDELTQWIHRIHETADGTPKGLVAALGWDKIVAKTPNDVLVAVLDAMVTKVGLVVPPGRESTPKLPEAPAKAEPKPEPAAAAARAPRLPRLRHPAASRRRARPRARGEARAAAPTRTSRPRRTTSWSAPPPPGPEQTAVDGGGRPGSTSSWTKRCSSRIAARPPTAPRHIRAASPADEEDTEVKQLAARRSEKPPGARGPARR